MVREHCTKTQNGTQVKKFGNHCLKELTRIYSSVVYKSLCIILYMFDHFTVFTIVCLNKSNNIFFDHFTIVCLIKKFSCRMDIIFQNMKRFKGLINFVNQISNVRYE